MMKNSPRINSDKKASSSSTVKGNTSWKGNTSAKGSVTRKENTSAKESMNGKENMAGKAKASTKVNTAEKDKTKRQNTNNETNSYKESNGKQDRSYYKKEQNENIKPKSQSKGHIIKNKEEKNLGDKGSKFKTSKKKKYGEYECAHSKRCGGCHYLDLPYEEQLKIKQKQVSKLLSDFCKVHPILGMEHPYHYRNKVQAVFGRDAKGNIISGVYKEGTHQIIPTTSCLIEDKKADEIIGTIRGMLKSFKIKTYDEDSGFGLLRYVLVKRGFTSGEIMVVLVIASPILPSKKNFVAALRKAHPEITTIILNINNRTDSLILGERETVLYGKGYIEDTLCGNVFRISSKSFYQVNPVQTEHLYQLAIKAAGLTGKERVIDAYCGIGTIGLVASKNAKEVIGVEVNKEAIKDAISNAKRNGITNEHFYNSDATEFMIAMAEKGEKADVVFMDPPRAGSTEQFIDAVESIQPSKVVYISCNPVTLQRDLKYFIKKGYQVKEAWPVDMFPWTGHVETVCLLNKVK
jgi:23S rRNA (uracil1939-C5)-methyltransferase